MPQKRLELHLNKKYGKSKYTTKANDWVVLEFFECSNISFARKPEKHIKQMKSRKYTESPINNHDKWDWLVKKVCTT